MPHELFEDVDIWNSTVTQLLEDMETHQHEPNFISYELLDQTKIDPNSIDILQEGEKLIQKLVEHQDISADSIERQLRQLDVKFDSAIISKLEKVVETPVVDGVVIIKAEMEELADLVRESAFESHTQKEQSKKNTIQGQQEAADNDILFDEVFQGEMRDSYANVRTSVTPDKADNTKPDEGGS